MHKYVALALIFILALSSSMMIRPGISQITAPSTPEFTIQYVACPYDVPTTYSTDPYTGETITHPGYHVENKTSFFVIKNQPFTPYIENGSEVKLYYQVRYTGHYSEDWYEVYSPKNYPVQSDSKYTTISPTFNFQSLSASTDGAKIDIQVQALVGAIVFVNGRLWGAGDYYEFNGEKSERSNIQTLTVNLPTPSPQVSASQIPAPSQTITSTPNQPVSGNSSLFDIDWISLTTVALLGIIAVLLVFVVVFLRRRK